MINPFQAKTNQSYPTIPSTWPNRSIRRAARKSRAMPKEWQGFFMKFPHIKDFLKTGKQA